jgi:hypothetical protein
MHAVRSKALATAAAIAWLVATTEALAAPVAHFSRTSILFGGARVGDTSSTQPLFISNTGDADLTIVALTIGGPQATFFEIVGGTCAVASALPPSQRCRIDLVIKPKAQGGGFESINNGTLTVQSNATASSTDIALSGDTDAGPFVGTLLPVPEWVDFDPQTVQTQSVPQAFTVTNITRFLMHIERFFVSGNDSGDFALTLNPQCMPPAPLAAGESCTATVTFSPTSAGPRSSEIILGTTNINSGFWTNSYSLVGTGVAATGPIVVVEYYNQTLDHYFITWIAAEQANLDAGNTPTRWTRTGHMFKAYMSAQTGTSPVCRYYIPPGLGDSHFFGRGTAECDATGSAHPTFVLEEPRFMHVYLPNAGVCPSSMTPLYRVFSNRSDANHRYMTDRAVRDQMVARGWLAEGDGPDLVVMCGA